MKAIWIGMIGLAAVGIMPRGVWAHAFLETSEPKVGASIAKPPAQVRIAFTQAVEPAFSAIQVFGPDGKQVDKHDCRVDPKDRKALVVSLPTLGPGKYKVAWHVVSVDTHRTQGDFKFTVQ